MRLAFMLLAVAGCAAGEVPASRVLVTVLGAHGKPLADRQLRVDGRAAGRTGTQGATWLSLPRDGGSRVEVTVECPEAYLAPAPRKLRVHHVGVRRVTLACEPRSHHALLVVRAEGAEGAPVRANGEQVGVVGPSGTLHLDLLRPRGSELRVSVDTHARPDLRPSSPHVSVRLDRDEVVLLDQPLTSVSRPVRRPRPPPPPPPKPQPRRLRSL